MYTPHYTVCDFKMPHKLKTVESSIANETLRSKLLFVQICTAYWPMTNANIAHSMYEGKAPRISLVATPGIGCDDRISRTVWWKKEKKSIHSDWISLHRIEIEFTAWRREGLWSSRQPNVLPSKNFLDGWPLHPTANTSKPHSTSFMLPLVISNFLITVTRSFIVEDLHSNVHIHPLFMEYAPKKKSLFWLVYSQVSKDLYADK